MEEAPKSCQGRGNSCAGGVQGKAAVEELANQGVLTKQPVVQETLAAVASQEGLITEQFPSTGAPKEEREFEATLTGEVLFAGPAATGFSTPEAFTGEPAGEATLPAAAYT